MNADKQILVLSALIGVHRRLMLLFVELPFQIAEGCFDFLFSGWGRDD
jgi:hypothetical protein